VLFAVSLIVGSLVACEVIVGASVVLFGDRLPFPDIRRYLATAQELDRARHHFDPELGWRVPYQTRWGERPRSFRFGRPLVSAFGDSFTHGDEVAHHQTWSEQLAAMLEADVYNFGSSAYGIDQALLRFEKVFPQRPTETAILAFISWDIDRCVSVYWKFQSPDSNFALTKPRFVVDGGDLRLIANPIRTSDELESRLTDVAFVRKLAASDYWYNPHRLPELEFPRLMAFFHLSFWKYVWRPQSPDLWSWPSEARRISELILARFHESCLRMETRPLILHLPVVWEIVQYVEDGVLPAAAKFLAAFCQERGYRCLRPIEETRQLSLEEIDRLFTQGLAGGHLTPEGHRWIARYLAERLNREG
jgi:hypothetical protein